MAEKQRDKQEKAEDDLEESIDDDSEESIDDILKDLAALRTAVDVPSTASQTTVESRDSTPPTKISQQEELDRKFQNTIPRWVKAPWMYVTPTRDDQHKDWERKWTDLVVKFAQITERHILNLQDLSMMYPFYNSDLGKELNDDQLRSLADTLVLQQRAIWCDRQRIQVIWKSDLEWGEIIYQFMYDTGRIIERAILVIELQDMGEVWSSIPRENLINILQTLVEKGRATWIKFGESLTFIIF